MHSPFARTASLLLALLLPLALLPGCGGGVAQPAEPSSRAPAEPSPANPDGEVPLPTPAGRPLAELTPGPFRRTAFSQALRHSYGSANGVTFRMKVPLRSEGQRLKVAFRAGDGPLTLRAATVARAGAGGALTGPIMTLTFGGAAGVTVPAHERRESDWAPFPVQAGDELAVSFECSGTPAANGIESYPDSWARAGSYAASEKAMPNAVAEHRLVAVAEVAVEAPARQLTFLAIGDSITEGYMTGTDDDVRQAWPQVMSRALGRPVAVAAVSSQGLADALKNLPEDVEPLSPVTDCIVLLGTNDLFGMELPELAQRTLELYAALAPRCRVWAGTLLPKERTSRGDLAQVRARRTAYNAWLRTLAPVSGVIDFEAALRSPESPDDFPPGLATDGIHPSAQGQQLMGQTAAAYFRPRLESLEGKRSP